MLREVQAQLVVDPGLCLTCQSPDFEKSFKYEETYILNQVVNIFKASKTSFPLWRGTGHVICHLFPWQMLN